MRRAGSCRSWIRGTLLLLAPTLLGAPVSGQTAARPVLTLDDIYSTSGSLAFAGRPISGLQWIDDARYAWPRPQPGGVQWLTVDAVTGDTRPLYDPSRMERALQDAPDISADEARRLSRSRDLQFAPDWRAALFTVGDDLYAYGFEAGRVQRLSSTAGTEEIPTFSPDGQLVAYVRDGDLFTAETASGEEHQLTHDGAPALLNGRLDWVYEEELYGRGNPRGYWWSPDSQAIAFLRLDDSAVPAVAVVDHLPYHQRIETWHYPKAGDPNPTVTLGVADAHGGGLTWVDTRAHAEATGGDFLIANVGWAPGGDRLTYQVQDREQNWLELWTADAERGRPTRLLRETSDTWVNCGNLGCQDSDGNPAWLADGSFLWFSERSGWRHLYHYTADGTLQRPVTSGPWEVRDLHGVDEQTGWVYLSGTAASPIGDDVYRVRLDGSDLTRLSRQDGTHRPAFNPGHSMYLDRWSDISTPIQTRLHRAEGTEIRTIDANPVDVLDRFALPQPEFLQVPARDGFLMEAMLIKPPDFDPNRRYPVYQWTYGGPHTPRVRNAWTYETVFLQLLAQHGIVVWVCDNRTASGKGQEATEAAFQRFGASELEDVDDGLDWLEAQGFVDPARIGLSGWSYGGFLTAYAMTHSERFAMGIAGGTVSDWRDYDSIYTERYLQTPEHNPDGYRASSPRFFADRLHGRILLIHGTLDENVHLQNTLQFAQALQLAGKPFDLMLYPNNRHSVTDPSQAYHLRRMMLDFILETLQP